MKLNLKNPIVVLDLETTGLDIAKDRIIEICIIKIMPNGNEDIKIRRLNPTIPISPEASAVHGIYDDDVKNCPTFREIAKNLSTYIDGCDFIGYNSIKFDIPLLAEEFLRAGIDIDFRNRKMIDVQNIFHKMEQRTLVAAYKFYCNKNLDNAHSAEADTRATIEVLESQLDRYSELQNDMAYLSEFSTKSRNVDYAGRFVYNDKDEVIVNFGKHKGRLLSDVLKTEPSYYDWMMNSDFALDTKNILTKIRHSEMNKLF
ncbi:MAG: 3'-5' exonuclease [Prevotellaceae bacterium]|jgi:DNA polymerase-3 subunit epsilon|nr:3'-5' exonuclease [Prevotellaceae bacterium]